MKEDLVKFETAKKLKELSKDSFLDFYYAYRSDGSIMELNDIIEDNSEYPVLCSAPTKSLVKRWLRKVHNIVIFVGCVSDFQWIDSNCTGKSKATVEYWDYDILVVEKWLYDNTFHSANKFDTYEEALEAAIEEALTLI